MGGADTIFDNITKDDIVFAFFPCIRFENQIYMAFWGNQYQQKSWSDLQKLEYDLQLHSELSLFYEMITKLVIICIKRGLKLIIENPYSTEHYLYRYWALRPKIIDKDRTLRGDYYKKPTQFWFVNCEPKENFIFESIPYIEYKTIANTRNKVDRSLISPYYANRFIREYVLDGE